MVTFIIKIAEKTVKVNALFEKTMYFCKDYIVGENEPYDIEVTMTDELILNERERSAKDITVPATDEYLELLALYRLIADELTDMDIMMFHGSAIAVDGEAYIFTADSGTGKSTHTRLWREYFGERAVMVNDDKPLISFKNGIAYVHGTPWNGKHKLSTNISVPIKAICILERAEENHIEKADIRDAFPKLFTQTYRPSTPKRLVKTMSYIDRLAKSVGLFKLGCNMELSAAEVAYLGMQNS